MKGRACAGTCGKTGKINHYMSPPSTASGPTGCIIQLYHPGRPLGRHVEERQCLVSFAESWGWDTEPSGQSIQLGDQTNMTCSCHCCLATKLCPTLCDPMDCHPPGSSVRGIFQAGVLEWVAISFSSGSSQPRDQTHVSCIGRWILSHLGRKNRSE